MSIGWKQSIARKVARELQMAAAGATVRLSPGAQRIQPNKVVLCNHYGDGYGCNPKYIAQALLDQDDPLDLVWLANAHDASAPSAIRQVPYGSREAALELATAKVWVDNYRTRRYVSKKPGQFYVQTWHGSVGQKKIEADARACLSAAYLVGARRDGRETDLMFANNDLYARVYAESFSYTGPVLRCGVPRNAPLANPSDDLRRQVRKALGVPDRAALCLYAPTFRDGLGSSALEPNLDVLGRALESRFGRPFAVAVRRHPNVAAAGISAPNTIDATGYPDVQELLVATDALVTDYSSIAEDYSLLARPGYLFVPDESAYESKRGFYYRSEERPFPLARTEDELLDLIQATTDEEFAAKRTAFRELVGMVEDGCGGAAVAEVILRVVRGEDPFA